MKSYRLFYCIAVLLIAISSVSCKNKTPEVKQTKIEFKKEGELSIFKGQSDTLKVTLDIEISDTAYERQTGLMYRDNMDMKQGMLFVFKDEAKRFFYMKNTKIALDIIYISADKRIVSFQNNAEPYNETSLPSGLPAQYVLEINAGLAKQWQLAKGDRLSW
jgi:uncharacterized membrane protein (UPF0127 family)